jgi:hypothetical protein
VWVPCLTRARAAASSVGPFVAGLSLCFAAVGTAHAKPEAPGIFCETYPQAAECSGRVVQCRLCHDSTYPPAWNKYGLSVMSKLKRDVSFAQALPGALAAVADDDADEDGVLNTDEIKGGTYPGDAHSFWKKPADPKGAANPSYRVGDYDTAFAYRRASVLYCGQSPSFDELAAFRSTDAEPDALQDKLHERLSECLDGAYWRNEGLKRLGDTRIRPAKNAGNESNVMIGQFRLVIGDYDWDYRLWQYVLTGDRDARDLLLARYFVRENEKGEWETTEEMIPKLDPMAIAGGQLLEKERRVGMLTTQWFLARNTMFSELPRTSAAAAYRAYLGADISMTQGLEPVAGEPDDVDNKGVKEARCASCHSTLDPLSYAFTKYEGISTNRGMVELPNGERNFPFGVYDEARPTRVMPSWSDSEQQSVIFGQNVSTLREWAEVAVKSDAFARNIAQLFFEHALSRGPEADEIEEFTALWRALPDDNFSANKLIHRLVDSRAFGVP